MKIMQKTTATIIILVALLQLTAAAESIEGTWELTGTQKTQILGDSATKSYQDSITFKENKRFIGEKMEGKWDLEENKLQLKLYEQPKRKTLTTLVNNLLGARARVTNIKRVETDLKLKNNTFKGTITYYYTVKLPLYGNTELEIKTIETIKAKKITN